MYRKYASSPNDSSVRPQSKHPHVAGAHHESLLPELRWGMNKTWPEDGRDHSARKLWAGSGEITSSQAIRKILSSDSSTCRKGLHRNIRSVSHSLAAHASAPHRCESVNVQCL